MKDAITFDDACAVLDAALTGSARQQIVSDAMAAKTLGQALLRLRDGMRSHTWRAAGVLNLAPLVAAYDRQTRLEGFHVLHDWDGVADHVNDDNIPVDVLHFVIDHRGAERPDRAVLAILLDYYFMHILGLLSVRVWDAGDAGDHLDRLTTLLGYLQGPLGSGQRFADNAETLMLIATSHFEIHEHGYGTLLERVRTLGPAHRATIALTHAASIGSHLRFGFEATYAGDTAAMRGDNTADYPWLCFALATLLEEYDRLREAGRDGRDLDRVAEALLNGLSPDVTALLGDPPQSPMVAASERSRLGELFQAHRADLLKAFDRHRPLDSGYSPLSFFFNFSHNVVKGTVIDALLSGDAWNLALNDLLAGSPAGVARAESKTRLATTLMGYARANPDRIRGRLMPVIVYDPQAGRRAFARAVRTMAEAS